MSSSSDNDKEITETITNPLETMNRTWEKIKSAEYEVLILFSSPNVFTHQERVGGLQMLKGMCKNNKVLEIKILTPKNTRVEELRSELKKQRYSIDVKFVPIFSQTKMTIAIVDRKASIVIELRNDNTMDTLEAIGQSTHSTRILTVLSYVSIFESYWTLSSLFEESESELADTKEYLDKVLNELDLLKK